MTEPSAAGAPEDHLDGSVPEGDDQGSSSDDAPGDGWLSGGIASVGAASFFSDSGHEIATALLPSFVTSVLHGSAGALGVMEGVSDALMGVVTTVVGPLVNDPRRRRRVATGGYVGTALATGAIGLATAVWQAAALRAVAWMARGARSPARDSLLASLAAEGAYGRAFGVERAGDNLGAVVGPLAAAGLVRWIGIRAAIWCAAIPGFLAAVAIIGAGRAARHLPTSQRHRIRLQLRELRSEGALRPMVPIACFECGNTAVTLLILRATALLHGNGRSLVAATTVTLFIYSASNAAAALTSFGGGHWVDRSGPRRSFVVGALLYVAAYVGFASGPTQWPLLLLAFLLAGSGIGLNEPSESALIAMVTPDHLRGSAFGVLGGVRAVGDVVSSVTVGILYSVISPTAAFGYAAAWMVLAVLTSPLLAERR